MKNKIKKEVLVNIGLIILTIIFFSYNIVICVDSSHYCWLASLIENKTSFANWDVARGIIFPLIIHTLNAFFGNNVVSLQIGMFIAYGIAIIICYCIYRDIKKEYNINNILKIVIGILFIFAVVLNPLIFGYYHTILTEYISMTACLVLAYFVWKWIHIDFVNYKIKYSIYTIYFAISMIIMWHLKQPYVLTVLAPIIIGTILSIIENFNWKNILQRLATILICLVALYISLKVWNFALNILSVNVEDTRTSSGFLSNQILTGMSEYCCISDEEEYKIDNIEKNEKISSEDKEIIISILNGKSEKYKNFILVECAPYRDLESSKEIKVIFLKEENLSVAESLKFLISTFVENPKSIIEGYFNNYLTTIGLYRGKTVGITSTVTKELTFSGTYENSYIAYNIYRDTSNNLNVPEHYTPYIENYNGINRQIKIVNIFMNKVSLITIYTFKLFLLIVPILFIITFVIFIILKIKNVENKKLKIYEILVILYGYSFLNVLMYSVLGALIDRYAISSYLAVNVAILIHFTYISILIIDKIKKQNNKKNEKSPIKLIKSTNENKLK